ncbi:MULTISPECIES: alpha-amylase family glycosyl hydrolase [unclassified Roseovarius]|uniref:alpha-amylase family glycosyl hydrolase n=1 Tax=unclassified Roseovarius TaxID=2614913 RepID=UPI00273F11DF|nr:alpha-amylase family glycosyl hydrolase [Roseovarius sp. MMSF_3350]
MPPEPWPRCPVIYEIYPRSFRDTTGSGTGDLQGVLNGLDHVADLGVDAIWIAPFYASTMEDGGYDIIDHCAVDPAMGDLDTVRRIIDGAHELGLRVLTDQVLNHTSYRNVWFEKSANRQDGFDDWYVWRDAKPDGTAPNNWMSYFGPPAWTWDHRREQYYWHQFLACQPNLNLRHEDVQAALKAQMRFWRDLGVDGFRMDAISAYLHDETFADNPVATPDVRERVAGPSFSPYARQDHKYDLLPGDGAAYCDKVRDWAGEDAYLLGEINVGNEAVELARQFTEKGRLDTTYTIDFRERGFTPRVIADVLDRAARRGEPAGRLTMWLSSHDQARHVSTFGDGSARDARFLAMAAGCLPGPWLIFQGEELGLPQPDLSREETTDPFDLMFWPDGPGREGPRVPIPWTEEGNAFGFTSGTPWLPMRWSEGASVQAQSQDNGSVLNFYKILLHLRRAHRFADGRIEAIEAKDDLLYLRTSCDAASFVVAMNFGTEQQRPISGITGECLLATENAVSADRLPPRAAGLWRLS